LTPSSGYIGTPVTLSISESNTPIQGRYKILWSATNTFEQNQFSVLQEGTIPTSATAFTTQVVIPESAFGCHYIRFQPDNTNIYTGFQFSVKPRFLIDNPAVRPGDSVFLSGTGFPANENIILKINTTIMNTTIVTGQSGTFNYRLQIPPLPPGENRLCATSDTQSIYEIAYFMIIPPIVKPPPPAPQSDNKTSNVGISSFVPPPMGDFTPPPSPVPLSPMGSKIGAFGTQPVTFTWLPSSDPSGVKYTLEVSSNRDFVSAQPLIHESNLSDNSYSTYLEPGIYYWRVKAVDGAGNESNWLFAPHTFQVGELSVTLNEFTDSFKKNEMMMMLLYISGAIFAIWIVVSIIMAIFRKPSKKDDSYDF
jgi:hypothetical protein